MKFVSLFFLVVIISVFSICSCKVDPKLPPDAVVLEQIIYADEVIKGTPQTIQMPNGTGVTYKMPEKLTDGQLIKVRDVPGERPYYIRVRIRFRDEQKKQ
jgi:hypothetical protein